MNKLWTQNDKNTLKDAFSLMEMMVVLLIVAILAAATAPMVTKKMARNAGAGDSPWVFTGLNSSIAYNLNGNDNAPVIIGATSTPASLTAPTRLFIDSGNTASHIAFGNGNATPLGITADPANGRIGISNQRVPKNSIAFGSGQAITDTLKVVVLGQGAIATADDTIVIGEAAASGSAAVAIGNYANAPRVGSIAIGGLVREVGNPDWGNTIANGEGAIAIGSSMSTRTCAVGENSIAIGRGAQATKSNSVAIGAGVSTKAEDQIVLGTANSTVYIPGNLIAKGTILLGSSGHDTYIYTNHKDDGAEGYNIMYRADEGTNHNRWQSMANKGASDLKLVDETFKVHNSDRRLKNVGEAYTAGLDELKKLDFFHYTFKKDEAKTPRVGVMAQDLQKVFPNAVTKGEDGYLRIRMEDMFYAVINAVKELDTKITEIVENVTSLSKKVNEQEKTIAEQQKLIEDLEQRLAKIEKKSKKGAE